MILDQPRALGQFVAEGARRNFRALNPRKFAAYFTRATPKELVLIPQDLRTSDPVLAQEFYNGIFSFGGHRVETGGTSPFRFSANQSNIENSLSENYLSTEALDDWQCELHSFRWLRHLSSSQNAISNSHAQALLRDWIGDFSKPRNNIAWRPQIAAHRLIAWMNHSNLLVEGADIALYKRFLKAIGTHKLFLRKGLSQFSDGLPKLQIHIALAYLDLCVKFHRQKKNPAANWVHVTLGDMLARQIYADGGHVTRCPSVLTDIMIDLLPLREAYEHLGISPPQQMLSAIDRMMPAIRYYRHRDGSFARFNGVSTSKQDLIATILRYDDAMGEPTQAASQSGYQRMIGGPTTILMDVGKPPKGEYSINAHAGCLSFEMSSARTCFITNCGAPEMGNEAMISASRSTAAHSTAVINNTSSCRFHRSKIFKRYLGSRILAGPGRVISERKSFEGYTQLIARHDGYLRQFGVWHERILQLSNDGKMLFGRDNFFANGGKLPKHLSRDDCAIRFHLHPSVHAAIDPSDGAIIIQASENQSWKFSSDNGEVGLEESIFFASKARSMPTSQIVININLSSISEVNWKLSQTFGTRQH